MDAASDVASQAKNAYYNVEDGFKQFADDIMTMAKLKSPAPDQLRLQAERLVKLAEEATQKAKDAAAGGVQQGASSIGGTIQHAAAAVGDKISETASAVASGAKNLVSNTQETLSHGGDELLRMAHLRAPTPEYLASEAERLQREAADAVQKAKDAGWKGAASVGASIGERISDAANAAATQAKNLVSETQEGIKHTGEDLLRRAHLKAPTPEYLAAEAQRLQREAKEALQKARDAGQGSASFGETIQNAAESIGGKISDVADKAKSFVSETQESIKHTGDDLLRKAHFKAPTAESLALEAERLQKEAEAAMQKARAAGAYPPSPTTSYMSRFLHLFQGFVGWPARTKQQVRT
jgi:hypothetical protein